MTINERIVIRHSKRHMNFHFEYSLKPQKNELEDREYTSYGVSATKVDGYGKRETISVLDITSESVVALRLIKLLKSHMVSPMCLKMFVENFLADMELYDGVSVL